MSILRPVLSYRCHNRQYRLSTFHRCSPMVGIDQIVGRIGKKRRALACCCPLAGWIRMRCELGFYHRCCTKGGVIENVEMLSNSVRRIAWVNCRLVPSSFSVAFCLLASASIKQGICSKLLAAHQTIRNAALDSLLNKCRGKALSRKRPCLFFEKVEWSGVGSYRSR